MMDDFSIPGRLIPSGTVYQWADREFLPTCLGAGWTKVPYERHKDWFDPRYREEDHYEVHGMTLIEKPSEQVKAQRQQEIAQAIENEVKAIANIEALVRGEDAPFDLKVKRTVQMERS